MGTMTGTDRTWLVLLRDISHAVRVSGEPRIVASLVFDMGTGVVLSSAIAALEEEVLEKVCQFALTKPAGGLAPRPPDRILCNPRLAQPLKAQIRKLKMPAPTPPISEVSPVHEAEDVFDSFVGHLAGRSSATEIAQPSDWQLLFDQVLHFYRREIWTRWADDVPLLLEVTLGGHEKAFTGVILGHERIQYGVVLCPGTDLPAGLRGEPFEDGPTMPARTLLLNFDPPQEAPEEFALKADRYGWPPNSELIPVFLMVDGREPGEPGMDDVRMLTVALTAMIAHDAIGPVVVKDGPPVTSGTSSLFEGESASFTIRQLPLPE